MTLGKITSSQNDLAFVKVRPETGVELETVTGGTLGTTEASVVGQAFTAAHWFGRIKIPISSAGDKNLIARLYDSPSKNTKYIETIFKEVGEDEVLHWIFDPQAAGSYYWELEVWNSNDPNFRVFFYNGSTFGGYYNDDVLQSNKSLRSKIVYCEDSEVERALAMTGDTVDSGVTTVKTGSPLTQINTGTVVGNISREADELNNGGKILNGSWFMEVDD